MLDVLYDTRESTIKRHSSKTSPQKTKRECAGREEISTFLQILSC